jgi:HEAT repeat protein
MATLTELKRLLALVVWDSRLSVTEGLTPFRNLLEHDADGHVLRFLSRELPNLQGQKRGAIAFAIAENYRRNGEMKKLQELFATDDENVKSSVLDALQGEPGSNPQMGPAIVQMAIQAMSLASPAVRTVASSVIQNQCAWGVDVKDAIGPLQELLKDENQRVRHQASYAVGNLAKRKYNMSACIPHLRRNVKHSVLYVREASAWALWHLSRSRHDISSAVPELIWLLTDENEYNGPRKQAAGALIHHAKKSPENAAAVRDRVRAAALDEEHKEIRKFASDLGTLK